MNRNPQGNTTIRTKTEKNRHKRQNYRKNVAARLQQAAYGPALTGPRSSIGASGIKLGFDKFKLGPIDFSGGRFETSAARNPSGMVGLGERAIDIQRTVPRLMSAFDEQGNLVDRIIGTDLLTTLTSGSSGNNPGDLLLSQLVSPSAFQYTRLAQFAALYQRYRFRRIRFLYEPIANATQSGQLIIYPDFDVDNILTGNLASNIAIAAAHQNQQITQIWQPMWCDFGQVRSFTDLFTEVGGTPGDDLRLSIQGVFYVICASEIGASLPLGNIYVDYEVDFSIPFLNPVTSGSTISSSQYGAITFTNPTGGSQGNFGTPVPLTSTGPVTVSSTGSALTFSNIPAFSDSGTFTFTFVGTTGSSATSLSGSLVPVVTGMKVIEWNSIQTYTGSFLVVAVSLSASISPGATSLSLGFTGSIATGELAGDYSSSVSPPAAPARSLRTRDISRRLIALEAAMMKLSLRGLDPEVPEDEPRGNLPVVQQVPRAPSFGFGYASSSPLPVPVPFSSGQARTAHYQEGSRSREC